MGGSQRPASRTEGGRARVVRPGCRDDLTPPLGDRVELLALDLAEVDHDGAAVAVVDKVRPESA